ncbi:MAG: hypothetical protein ACJ79L_05280, partial [Anaeromyxobacteraceae bacterium]
MKALDVHSPLDPARAGHAGPRGAKQARSAGVAGAFRDALGNALARGGAAAEPDGAAPAGPGANAAAPVAKGHAAPG